MTKKIKLTKHFMDLVFHGPLMKGKKMHGKYHLFNYTPLAAVGRISEGEGYKSADVAKDPTNVPIYNQKMVPILDSEGKIIGEEKHSDWGKVIRYEGSVENPIECYGCNCDDIMEIPTAKANEFLAMKIDTKDEKGRIVRGNYFQAVSDQ